ncbi:taste receptor type 2 member 143-like [Anomaloglossus baeobatrachus]|uniref:taste receptor type 2 member 143-like n=1 Tax=Anomaloglossus baeobatrachus TaxID=238106 RepID=UPI003F4FFCCA
MPSTGWMLLLVFGMLDSLTTFVLNIHILVASAKRLRTRQKMNPPDLIYLVIGVVNIALQCLLGYQGILCVFSLLSLFNQKIFFTTIVGNLTLLYFTNWLTAWLCIYYCVTISNFNHPFFLWSKRNISMYLPRLLLLSAAIYFLISLPAIWMASVEVTRQSPVNSTFDPIFISGAFHFQPLYIQTALFMGCCMPFLLILVSIMVTNTSLLRHLYKMRQKDSGLSQTKDQAHVNAIRTMWCFLIISIIFYISENLFFSMSLNPEDPYTIFSWLIFMSFPVAESLVIIFANTKLRRQIMAMVLWFSRKP